MASYRDAIIQLCREQSDLSVRQLATLEVCRMHADNEERRQVKAIAKTLNISKPAVTRATDRLLTNGLVKRGQVFGDRRSCTVTLTPAGLKLLDRIEAGTPPSRKAA